MAISRRQTGAGLSAVTRKNSAVQIHEFILRLETLEGNTKHRDGWRVRVLKEMYRNPRTISELAKAVRKNSSDVHMLLQNRHIKEIVEEEHRRGQVVQKLTPEGRKLVKAYLRKG
ncbi:MAG: hypothetical protein KGH57_01565 [Candidatus Micrarchaeota archaeon]|nr:hypothetical protein [Candidatus Micrarchaeota archaeon]